LIGKWPDTKSYTIVQFSSAAPQNLTRDPANYIFAANVSQIPIKHQGVWTDLQPNRRAAGPGPPAECTCSIKPRLAPKQLQRTCKFVMDNLELPVANVH
jgi:hypothetical protein